VAGPGAERAGRIRIQEEAKMKKRTQFIALVLAVGALAGIAATTRASVTEKVDSMIAENSPLKVNDNDLWLMVGGPLVFGVQYDKYATGNVALGVGAGSYLDGLSLDLQIKYYFLTGKFSPFLAVGPVFYYSRPSQNIFAVDGAAGFSYFFDGGFGLSLAFVYTKGISKSEEPFSTQWVNDSIAWPAPQFGIHWNY
jgi:hypothetical protein